MSNNNNKFKISKNNNTICVLKKDARKPFTAEEQAVWDRFTETSFCALLQNGKALETPSNTVLVEQAAQMADTLLNLRRERFDDSSNDDEYSGEDTGVFKVVPFGINNGRKALG